MLVVEFQDETVEEPLTLAYEIDKLFLFFLYNGDLVNNIESGGIN